MDCVWCYLWKLREMEEPRAGAMENTEGKGSQLQEEIKKKTSKKPHKLLKVDLEAEVIVQ